MRHSRRGHCERSVDHLIDSWLSDFELELRALLPVGSVLSTMSALGTPTRLPVGLTLEMLSPRMFRISLATGVSLEQVDVLLDRSCEPVRAMYHYDGLTGWCDLNVNVRSDLFKFVADCYRRFST